MAKKTVLLLTAVLLLLAPLAATAQEEAPVTLESLMQMLEKQQKTLESQQKLIEQQTAELEDHRKALAALQSQHDQMALHAGQDTAAPSDETVKLNERLAAVEAQVKGRTDEPENMNLAGDFPGSIRIPGTNMSGKVGGYVRLGIVNSLDPVGSDDRFIVGSIPVEETGADSEGSKGVTISAKRSRVNLDMRMDSSVGRFRAFIEGDFATEVGSDSVYRLRHAFGQYKNFILGQTWSTFMDQRASPEELDFEGLNAYVNERRPIFRWSTSLERKRSFAIGVEDPSTEILDGTGVGDLPDLVARLTTTRGWGHFQTAVVLRQLAAEPLDNPEVTSTDFGWGVSLSGNNRFSFWSKNDNFKYQFNFGQGIGKYINDMASVGGLDAVFDPEGNLRALTAFAGYMAFQHYWKRDPFSVFGGKDLLKNLRSTLVYGFTQVDAFDFQPGDSYRRTRRASLNLVWSPISAIDLGFELLWGERLNLDKKSATARQIQMVASFYF